jgi:hypothetical protein
MPKGNGKSKGAIKTGPPPRNMSYCDENPRANQHYAKITQVYGHGKVQVSYFGKSVPKDSKNDPGSTRLREIIANVRQRRGLNKLRVVNGSFAIISLRDFEPGMADILHVYRDDEVKTLRHRNELPTEIDSGAHTKDAEVVFGYDDHNDDIAEIVYSVDERLDQYGIPIEQNIENDSDSDSD